MGSEMCEMEMKKDGQVEERLQFIVWDRGGVNFRPLVNLIFPRYSKEQGKLNEKPPQKPTPNPSLPNFP